MSEFKFLEVKKITADVNQPRKFFDTSAMTELVESIKTNGVLQPILVRPKGKGYMLVCGERRYRATKEAGLTEVPAVIREMTDDEALEAQIIENLQRKDVHPMEEAVAFNSLIENKKYSVIEVAARVGKKDWFVKQRLKLNDLIEPWQQVFFSNKMSLQDALQIAPLSVIAQKDLFDNQNNVDEPNYRLELSSWILNRYKGNLNEASFDLSNPHIDIKAGACINCQFNTAAAQLFPDDDKSPRCTNIICFKNKSDIHFIEEFAKAKEDPAMLFVNDGYNETDYVKKLKKESLPVLKEYDDFREISAPEKPDWENHKNDYDDDDTEEFIKEEFKKSVAEYDKDIIAYNKKIASGKYKMAFIVDGNNKGKYIYIELQKSGSQKQAKAALENNGEVTAEDIDEEIERIKSREKAL
ncbi:MAG: ParB/RepB/Spo0J family partition protein [Chitinophagaceae bacterium]|nr:ParB/RepB/Spo0J family partition protein [Chitinophagaceae bacterium]